MGKRKIPRIMLVILVLGFIHGLIYVILIPPWQHYDEPGHFEYTWLIANKTILPKVGEYDPDMRHDVAVSMIAHNFFSNPDAIPDLNTVDSPIWIGISQVGDPPLYSWLSALILIPLRGIEITLQLYAVRFVSIIMYLITVISAWGCMSELVSKNNPLLWLVPATLVLLPGFVDIMTSHNNDVGAVMFFSLFLWGALRILNRGFSWLRLIWITSTALLCIFTKNTVSISILIGLVVLWLIMPLKNNRIRLWLPILIASLVILVLGIGVLNWGDAAFWHRVGNQTIPSRIHSDERILGDYIFQVLRSQDDPTMMIRHLLPGNIATDLSGNTITLGAWIWSDTPHVTVTPVYRIYEVGTYYQKFKVGTTPKFFAFSHTLPEYSTIAWIVIAPALQSDDENVHVYYDGVT
jgi:hypothetical protein